MAAELIDPVLRASAWILALAVVIDLLIGDPAYPWHPVRLIGGFLASRERALRSLGADGYGGGVTLAVLLCAVCVGLTSLAVALANEVSPWLAAAVHLFLVYSFIALGDLLHHVWAVERPLARGDLAGARTAISHLVGRDTDRMDAGACRRAAVESLSENLTDGVTSPLFWYLLGGLPGLVLFKVASTMDSMVGYKTPKYLKFGWAGARLDDVMNYVPARLTWLLLGACAVVLPGCSAIKAWRVGWQQHQVLLGPNSGWSEAATAGGIQRRIVGPIWLHGAMVTDVWIGDPADPPVETRSDLIRAMTLVTVCGLLAAAVVIALLLI